SNLKALTARCYEHIDNNHSSPGKVQSEELKDMRKFMEDVFKVETEILVTDKLLKFDLTQDKLPEFRKLIQKLDKGQVDRIKKNIDSTKNSLLFLEVISDCENIMTHSVNLTNALKNNLIASKKTDENGNDEEEN
ncbi:MAG: hypothetical protein RBR95_04825, partial [Ignavibacteriaceae bacterium]|nr:hypothetical protein [Ignavibacteriaceae bacterium]